MKPVALVETRPQACEAGHFFHIKLFFRLNNEEL